MWDIAPSYGAMLVFVEHRYYGQSLPFGDDSFKDLDHLQFLTSTQALADFATFITTFQEKLVVRLYPFSHDQTFHSLHEPLQILTTYVMTHDLHRLCTTSVVL